MLLEPLIADTPPHYDDQIVPWLLALPMDCTAYVCCIAL